jgi:hypothetical protein
MTTLHKTCKAKAVRLPVSSGGTERTADDLPSGLVVSSGKLTVEFASPEDLFAKLFELAQAAANDFDGVCKALVGTFNSGESHPGDGKDRAIPAVVNRAG